MNAAFHPAGYLPDDAQAMIFLIVWILLVLGYGFFRSTGDGKPDPIVPSGPSGVLDREG